MDGGAVQEMKDRKAYMRLWYAANREKRRAYDKKYSDANREKLRRYSRSWYYAQRVLVHAAKAKPCVDCGKHYPPYVMDFDHVRGSKRKAISKWRGTTALLLLEIGKCDLVCANCHRERTYQRAK